MYIIPQIQNVQSQNCIYITCCGDSPRYFVKDMRYLLYLTFKVRYSKYLMFSWQLHGTTRETPPVNWTPPVNSKRTGTLTQYNNPYNRMKPC